MSLFVNESKDQEPAHDNILLGSQVDTINLMFRISITKIEEIKELIEDALSRKYLHVKFLACIVGKIIGFQRSMGPIVRIISRAIYHTIS